MFFETTPRLKIFIFCIVFSTLFGIGMEFLQKIYFPDRSAEIWDIVANTTGAISGGLLYKKLNNLLVKIYHSVF